MGVDVSKRLMSLDALRGFDMFWILYPTYPIFHALLVAMGFGGCWLDVQMTHPAWDGFTFYDTIFPLFLFMAGVSFPYSCASSLEKGLPRWRVALRVVKRSFLLWLLGLATAFGGPHSLSSVIGRIGISWGAAALLYMAFGWRARAGIFAAILAVYGVFPFAVGAPGAPADASPYGAATCIYTWMDAHFFPKPYVAGGASGVFAMVATAMLGMFAGDWLRLERPGLERPRKAAGLGLAAVCAVLLGVFLAFGLGRWSIPLVKNIWSSSFALVAGGYSLAMLALFYWVIDVKGCRAWSFPFRVIGMNAIFAYLASRTLFPFRWEMEYMFGRIMRMCPTREWGEFAGQACFLAVYWLLLLFMYRRKIFLKV